MVTKRLRAVEGSFCTKMSLLVEGDWLGKSASFKEQNNGARSDVEHGSHVTLTMHKQYPDGVRSVVVKCRSDAFCEEFRRDTLIEIIETNEDDEIDQYMCFSAAVNEVRFFINGHTELSIAEIEYVLPDVSLYQLWSFQIHSLTYRNS